MTNSENDAKQQNDPYAQLTVKMNESRKCIQRIGATVPKQQDFMDTQVDLLKQKIEQQSSLIERQHEEVKSLQQKVESTIDHPLVDRTGYRMTTNELNIKLKERDAEIENLKYRIDQFALQLKMRESQMVEMAIMTQIINKNIQATAKVQDFDQLSIEKYLDPLCQTFSTRNEIQHQKVVVGQRLYEYILGLTNELIITVRELKVQNESLRQKQKRYDQEENKLQDDVQKALENQTHKYQKEIKSLKTEIFELKEYLRSKELRIADLSRENHRNIQNGKTAEYLKDVQYQTINKQREQIEKMSLRSTEKVVQTRELLTDFQKQIDSKLRNVQKENQKIQNDHQEVIDAIIDRKREKSIVGTKLNTIYKELDELKGIYGINGQLRSDE
ncbi:Hypothetical_protein [Hexamita inflata]|uniref:Hypothetical_protein n=2 Tax=Hexamita inflata TaxID=28002 RepID=A0AA86NQX2_9EUKA|nr:Hypothetical protein HINF_LOCUS10850 [Hexamita inflata]